MIFFAVTQTPAPIHAPTADEIVRVMRARNPEADPLNVLPGVDPARIPRHVAIIMDGNGRWATARGLARVLGHKAGAKAVREVVTACGHAGVEALTLYSFSLENWARPVAEVDALMELCVAYLQGEKEELLRKNMRLRVIGEREGLPQRVLNAIDDVCNATAHGTSFTLCLAINYSARAELVHAAQSLAHDAAAGQVQPEAIDERTLASRLWTALPDPDVLIRTAGEMRISNFLLWQISYAELVVTPTLWPDFGREQLFDALREFAGRSRRFGGLQDRSGAVPAIGRPAHG